MDPGGITSFAALVMADEALAAHLAAIEDRGAFIAEAVRSAQAHGVALSAESLLAAAQPDPLGLARWSDTAPIGPSPPPRHWLPIAVAAANAAITVDWAWFGPEPLRAPFFEAAIRSALARPFNRAFRCRTGLDDLIARTDRTNCLAPSGFIFHMSRCGSTLVAQMLAALSASIVISEAAPIDAAVQVARGLPEEDGARLLRAFVLAFGRKRRGDERHYVVKLDCWHTLALPLFRRAFPDVPWLFLYREPVEVLVSQMRMRGMQMVPQFLAPGFFGIAADACSMDDDYCARVLAAVCRAVIVHHGLGGGLLVNYRQLPQAVGTAILPHFGISCCPDEQARMQQAAQQDAKTPCLPFVGDADAKQRAATDQIRRAADRNLAAIYSQLEALAGG